MSDTVRQVWSDKYLNRADGKWEVSKNRKNTQKLSSGSKTYSYLCAEWNPSGCRWVTFDSLRAALGGATWYSSGVNYSSGASSSRMFHRWGDVRIFLFNFENVSMCGKKEKDNSLELLTFLHRRELDFFSGCFKNNGEITAEVSKYPVVKMAFVEEIEEKEEPQEVILKAVVSALHPSNLRN